MILAGGPAALSTEVEQQTQEAGYNTRRIAGGTRTDTAEKVSRLLVEHRTHLRAMLSGAIFMYPAQLDCPDGMSRFTPLDGAFPRGGTTAEAGGSDRHHHMVDLDTDLGSPTDFGSQGFDPKYDHNTFDDPEPGSFHTHHTEGDTLSASNLPPYVNIRYCQLP